MKVKRNTLLLLACLVWSVAGFNILRIGLASYGAYVSITNLLLSGVVFLLFQKFVFGRLVRKHTARIASYWEERHFFMKFFDTKAFVIMAVILGAGDAFHLVPRAVALCTTGLENYTTSLGMGKWITSVTMTIFYVLLYYVWRRRYQVQGGSGLTAGVYFLAILRIVLCMMPQNQWLSANPPLSWGIWRNIPFALLGLVIIVLFYRSAKSRGDRAFRWMWLTILLSFGFYIPVVLWAEIVPMVGMLMIPKTCAYVWTVLIGYWAMKEEARKIG